MPRRITASEICIILHITRKPNLIVLLSVQNISRFSTGLPPRTLFQNFGLLLGTFSGHKKMFFFLADTPQKVDFV